ncbi:MAG: polysaccharide biosynthesis/export family protein [Paludibacteraceae bacterium]|nr:polysaccharide biosynthesis/export family protein [Paludibacteraceae bacterium]
MRKQVIKILVVLMTSVVLTGCYGHKAIGLLQEPTKQNKLPQYEKAEYEPYRLQVNDEIIYRVITMDETLAKTLGTNNVSAGSNYAVTYRIYQDGTVDIPFLQPVHLAGLTEREAQDTLQAAFRTIIPDADVKLALYNKTFTVIGDIRSGTYRIYREKMNIFQALAMSGDLLNSGDRKHVRIIRPRTNEEPEVLEFDIRTNSIVNSEYYYVYPNDVIYVARTKDSFVKVDSYTGFLGLITSSVGLLISALNFAVLFGK